MSLRMESVVKKHLVRQCQGIFDEKVAAKACGEKTKRM